MARQQPDWILTVPLNILKGLEGSLSLPPAGQKLLEELDPRLVEPESVVDEQREFEDAMRRADEAPDRRRALAARIVPHLAVLSGEPIAETEFGAWVLKQVPWFFTMKDDDFRHLAQWPGLRNVSVLQSRLSGGALDALADALPGLRLLRLVSNTLKAPFWGPLGRLRSLETLDIGGQKGFGDADVPVLFKLPALRSASFVGRALSGSALASLAGLGALEELSATPVDDETLVALSGAPKLRRLRSYLPAITDDGVRRLAEKGAGGLRELYFARCKLTDAGAAALAGMACLTHLCISSAKITNAGVQSLAALPNLIELDIGSCSKVTDKAVPALAGMRALTMLRVTGTKISPAGLGELGRALPRCNLVTKG